MIETERLALIITVLLALANFAHGEAIDFHAALQRALDKSPKYNSLVLTERNASLLESNGWSALLPSFDLNATHTYTQKNEPLHPSHYPWSNQAGLMITENLYDNGDTWRAAKIAGLNRRIEALNLQSGRSRLLVDVAKSFYDFSSANGGVELQKQQIEALRLQFHTIEGRYLRGLRNSRDFLRIKTQLQSAEIGLISQTLGLENARTALRTMIGEDGQPDFVPLVQLETPGLQFPVVNAENSYDVRIANLRESVATLIYESLHRTEWPRLNLKSSYNYVQPQYFGGKNAGLDNPYWNFQAMVTLDYHLWDWGQTRRKIEVAENLRRIEDNTQAQTRLQVVQNLDSLQKQVTLGKSSLLLSEQILKSSESSFHSLNLGYLEGRVNYIDLVTALNDLYASRSQNLNLRFSLLKLRAELAHNEGTVDDVLKIH